MTITSRLPTPIPLAVLATSFLFGCMPVSTIKPDTSRHIQATDTAKAADADIPPPVAYSYKLPPPKLVPKTETYSVVVSRVNVQDLLFALARDAKVNVDIHPDVRGVVTLNALDQTLPQLLARVAKQVDMRFELDGDNLAVMPDTPFLRHYKIDYVNMNRETTSTVSIATQIATGGAGLIGSGANNTGSGSNSSSARIENTSKNRFWDTLTQNLKDLLRETDKIFPEGTSETTLENQKNQNLAFAANSIGTGSAKKNQAAATKALASGTLPPQADGTVSENSSVKVATFREAASVIVNPESGVISVRASSRQHEKVQEFLDHIMTSAKRQVLIEATIAEVELSENYQQGIDFSKINVSGYGLRIVQKAAGKISAPASSLLELGFDSKGGNFGSTIKLLETFGNVKVLSSPRISVLNNQTAVLKVVDNTVYFTIDTNTNQNQTQTVTTYTTTVHTVPIGLVMNVTPQIGANNTVLLNIRPSLSRVIGSATDPNPALKAAGIANEIPIVRSREIESIMRIEDGNIAMMGGLMEDLLNNNDDTVPGLAKLPIVGALFQNRNDVKRKTELIIFLRPVIVRNASLEGDFQPFSTQLPDARFFAPQVGPSLLNLETGAQP